MEVQISVLHRRDRGYYLLTVNGEWFGHMQARAVMDDLGNLQIVRGWL